MRQKEVFKKIGGIIQELSEQYEYLETSPDNMNELELELFVANAHFLTDHIEILCKLNIQNNAARRPVIKQEPTYEQKYFEPMVRQMKQAVGLSEPALPKKTAKPVEVEKPVVIEPVEQVPVPEINIAVEAPTDTYSVMQEEPETDRAEFTLNEAANAENTEIITRRDELAKSAEKIAEDEAPAANEPLPAKEPVAVAASDLVEEPLVFEELFVYEPIAEVAETAIPTEPVIDEVAESQPEQEIISETALEVLQPEQVAEVEPEVFEVKFGSPGHTILTSDPESEIVTINDKISAQLGDKAVSKTEQLAIKPIGDIKLAITLNDKLLYVKDLFNGYNLAYSEAIEILNRFNTFEEASRFLKTNYVTKNNWESKPGTTEKFYALLRRRYA